jgi:branched-chain amino acid aminotransferase
MPVTTASLSVQDLAILRGYGVFDFLRTYNGRPFKLPEHLQRLAHSAEIIGLELPLPLGDIETIVHETLARNNLPEANIRIVVTGGVSPDGITPAARAGLIVLVSPPRRYPDEYYEHGIKTITVEIDRYLPTAKTINYIPAMIALRQARAVGALEALYVNQQQHILEGTTTNFFIFQGNRLITPVDQILPGVTRRVVLDLASQQFEVAEQAITFADLNQADEAFIAASNKEIMPVYQVNELRIGRETPGPNTQWLKDRFWELTRQGK